MVGAIVIAETGSALVRRAAEVSSRFDSNWRGWHAPLASIPVIGRSTVVRTVEYLKQGGIDEVAVFGGRSRGPMSTQPGDGQVEAWRSAARQLKAYRDDGINSVLVISCSGYVEIDLEDFVALHHREGNVISRAAASDGAIDLWVIDPQRFDMESDLSMLGSISTPEFEIAGYVNRLQGPQDVRRLASDLLTAKCRMRPQGTEIRPGVWIDEGAQVARGARVVAPAYVGKDAKIADDCLITRCSDIENDSQVDFGTAVEDTSVLSNTYVGIGLDLAHSVVDGEEVFNLHHQVRLRITDPVVVRRNSPRGQQHRRIPHQEVSEVTL